MSFTRHNKKDSEWQVSQRGNQSRLTAQPDMNILKGVLKGVVITPYGIVEVGTYYNVNNDTGYTDMTFVYNKQYYVRNIGKSYTKRGLAIVAGKWAKSIATK